MGNSQASEVVAETQYAELDGELYKVGTVATKSNNNETTTPPRKEHHVSEVSAAQLASPTSPLRAVSSKYIKNYSPPEIERLKKRLTRFYETHAKEPLKTISIDRVIGIEITEYQLFDKLYSKYSVDPRGEEEDAIKNNLFPVWGKKYEERNVVKAVFQLESGGGSSSASQSAATSAASGDGTTSPKRKSTSSSSPRKAVLGTVGLLEGGVPVTKYPPDEFARFKKRISIFYEKYASALLESLDTRLEGRLGACAEKEIFEALCRKYNVSPEQEQKEAGSYYPEGVEIELAGSPLAGSLNASLNLNASLGGGGGGSPMNKSRAFLPDSSLFGLSIKKYTPEDQHRLRNRLSHFYKKYAPEKMHVIDNALKMDVTEDDLFEALSSKYKGLPAVDNEEEHHKTATQLENLKIKDYTPEEKQRVKNRLLAFYKQQRNMDPSQIMNVDKVVELPHTEKQLFETLHLKYGGSSLISSYGPGERLALKKRLREFYDRVHAPVEKYQNIDAACRVDVTEALFLRKLEDRYQVHRYGAASGDYSSPSSSSEPSSAPGSGSGFAPTKKSSRKNKARQPKRIEDQALRAFDKPQGVRRRDTVAICSLNGTQQERLRSRLTLFYQAVDSSRIAMIDKILTMILTEGEIFQRLHEKYKNQMKPEDEVKKAHSLGLLPPIINNKNKEQEGEENDSDSYSDESEDEDDEEELEEGEMKEISDEAFHELHELQNDFKEIQRWVRKHGLNVCNSRGLTLLHVANDVRYLKFLLDAGMTVDVRDHHERTPLHYRCSRGANEGVVAFLLDRGANPNAQDDEGQTPLHMAAENGKGRTSSTLLKRGAKLDAVAEDGSTVFHAAAWGGQFDLFKYLCEKADEKKMSLFLIEQKDNSGVTPLAAAATDGHVEIVRFLKEKRGAKIDTLDKDGDAPIHRCTWDGHIPVARYFIEDCKINVDVREKSGLSPLAVAVYNQQKEMAEYLLSVGADVNAVDVNGDSVLVVAVQAHNLSLVKLLCAKGANVFLRNKEKANAALLASDFAKVNPGNNEIKAIAVFLGKLTLSLNEEKKKQKQKQGGGGGAGNEKAMNQIFGEKEQDAADSIMSSSKTPEKQQEQNENKKKTAEQEQQEEEKELEEFDFDLTGEDLEAVVDEAANAAEIVAECAAEEQAGEEGENQENYDDEEIPADILAAAEELANEPSSPSKASRILERHESKAAPSLSLFSSGAASAASSFKSKGGQNSLATTASANSSNAQHHPSLEESLGNLVVEEGEDDDDDEEPEKEESVVTGSASFRGGLNRHTIWHAAKVGDKGLIDTLLSQEPGLIDRKNSNGQTSLFIAATNGQLGVVKQLLLAGANFSMRDSAGWTPLHAASFYGHRDIAQVLLEKGASVSRKSNDTRSTPLHLAAESSIASKMMCRLLCLHPRC